MGILSSGYSLYFFFLFELYYKHFLENEMKAKSVEYYREKKQDTGIDKKSTFSDIEKK